MSDPVKHFLIVFDHQIDALLEARELGTKTAEALAAYAECEDHYRGQDAIEIVLVGSDSLESVRKTHTNYFTDEAVESKWLAAL